MPASLARIAKLEAAAARRAKPVDDYEVVDLTDFFARVAIRFIINANGKKARKNESDLTRLARAFRVKPERLMQLAWNDGRGFAKRFDRFKAVVGGCSSVDDVRLEVVRRFMAEECVHQHLEQCIEATGGEGGWLGRVMGEKPWPKLCAVRPCRPVAKAA